MIALHETSGTSSRVKSMFFLHLDHFQDVDPESLESLLTNEGHLVVRGKVKGAEDIKERTIDIQKEAGEAKDAGEQKWFYTSNMISVRQFIKNWVTTFLDNLIQWLRKQPELGEFRIV